MNLLNHLPWFHYNCRYLSVTNSISQNDYNSQILQIFQTLEHFEDNIMWQHSELPCNALITKCYISIVISTNYIGNRSFREASCNGYDGLFTYICICLLMSCPDHISCTHPKVFSEYFKELEEESIRDNFELMDELMDFGYPQTTDSKILQEYDEKKTFAHLISTCMRALCLVLQLYCI